MDKILRFLLLTLILFPASNTFASSIPTMSLSWSTGMTGISNFKLYYSSNSDMTDKKWHQECDNAVENPIGSKNFTMTCTNIPIITFPSFIQISATSTIQTEEILSNIQKISLSPAAPSIINIK